MAGSLLLLGAGTVGASDNSLTYIPHYGQSLSIGIDTQATEGIVSLSGSAATIIDISTANPAVVQTSAAHGLSDYDPVFIQGVGGATQANLHTFEVQVVDSTHVSLYYLDGEVPSATAVNGAVDFSPYTSGGTIQKVDESDTHFMFNGGVRAHYDDPDAYSNVNTHAFSNTMEALVPLAERTTKNNTQQGETLAFGAANKMTSRSLHCTMGRGAYTVTQLSRGNTTGFPHYSNNYAGMLNAYELAVAAGYDFALGPMIWKQGEADAQAATTKADYKTYLQALRSDLERSAPLATLTATGTFKLITDQISLSNSAYAPIAVAVIELHRADIGVHVLGPGYAPAYTYTAEASPVHLTGTGYRNVGEHYGIAIQSILDGNGWNPCYITNVTRTTTTITVTVHVPSGDLVADTTLVAALGDGFYGFAYSGANITDVSIGSTAANSCDITITIDADAGGTLSYAYNNGTANNNGATSGARGNIRDSASSTTNFDGTTLHNWLCIDQWTVA